MHGVNLLIANTNKSLVKHREIIESTFNKAVSVCTKKLMVKGIDIIVVDNPSATIPELGIGGYTATANLIYISIDSAKDIKKEDLFMAYSHEMHHAMRWRNPGIGTTFEEALYSEGLASLYEEEVSGRKPIYTNSKVNAKQIIAAEKIIKKTDYDYNLWFFTGNKEIPRWFGYSYGYKLAKEATKKLKKSASELAQTPVEVLAKS